MNEVRKLDALLTHFMHIPFPEQLADEVWIEKVRQFEYLFDMGFLPIQRKKPK